MDVVKQIQDFLKDQLPGYLGIEFVEAGPEKVVGRIRVREALCTTGGIVHGGTVMALADTLGAVGAFFNLPEGATTATVESKTNFLGSAKIGDVVTATSTLIHKGRTMMLWQAELRNDSGKLIAVASQSQIIMPRAA